MVNEHIIVDRMFLVYFLIFDMIKRLANTFDTKNETIMGGDLMFLVSCLIFDTITTNSTSLV